LLEQQNPIPYFSIDVRADPESRTQASNNITRRRPSRCRLGVARQRQWQQQWATTVVATSVMHLEKKNLVLQWGEGIDNVTGKRPSRRRLEVARRRLRVAVMAATRVARSHWCVLEEMNWVLQNGGKGFLIF